MDQWSGNLKAMVAAFNLAWSTNVKPMQQHTSPVRMPVNCCADTDELVNKYCFVHWVWGARHNTTVFDKAAGEFDGRLVEIRAGIIVYSVETFNLPHPVTPSQVVVGDVGASMEKQRFGLRFPARLRPAASRSRRMFQAFDVDSRPVPSGTAYLGSSKANPIMTCGVLFGSSTVSAPSTSP